MSQTRSEGLLVIMIVSGFVSSCVVLFIQYMRGTFRKCGL